MSASRSDGRSRSTLPEQRATVVPLGDGTVARESVVERPAEPEQVTVDPDRVLLDANPGEQRWKSAACMPASRPLYTMLDETDMTSDYDRLELHGRAVDVGAVVPGPVVHALDDDRPAGRGEPAAELPRRRLRRVPHRLPRPGPRRGRRLLGDHLEAGCELRAAHRRAVGRARRRRRAATGGRRTCGRS